MNDEVKMSGSALPDSAESEVVLACAIELGASIIQELVGRSISMASDGDVEELMAAALTNKLL